MPTFSSLGLPEVLVRSLATRGISEPFPIQAATLPDALAGRDVLGRGRTGSGKTLAFSLPMVARLAGLAGADGGTGRPAGADGAAGRPARRPRRPRGLVLAPTRELATQIAATLEPLAESVGLRVTTVFGGVSQHRQVTALDAGVDVVVACPGRLEDLLGQKLLTLDDVEVTVLDEADHMADLGFLPGVRRILSATPAGGQRLLFSATLDRGVDRLVREFLDRPTTHSVDSAESPVATMTHHLFTVDGVDTKRAVVQHLASGMGRRLLFTRTKHQAKKLAKQLTAAGIPAVDLHGNLSQNARERNLEAFSAGGVRVLVATDIAARGIHVDEVELVVHVDPPAEHKAYLHRSGRTARAGSGGDVVTVVLPEQTGDVRTLTRQAKITARPRPVRVGDPVLAELVGPVAPVVQPAPAGSRVEAGAAGGRGGAGGRRGAGGRGGAAGRGEAGGRSRSGGSGTGGSGSGGSRSGGSGSGGSGRRRRGGGPAEVGSGARDASAARGGSGASGGRGGSGARGDSGARGTNAQSRAAAAQGRSAISAFPVQPGGTGRQGSGSQRQGGGSQRRNGAVEMSRGGGRRRGR